MGLFDFISTRRRKAEPKLDAYEAAAPEPAIVPPPDYEQWWRDAVNAGAWFRVETNDPLRGSAFSEPYLRVRLADEGDADAEPFANAIQHLYVRGAGGILCRDGWSAEAKDKDCLWLRFGDLVDYKINGRLSAREPGTLGWGMPADPQRVRMEPPGFNILLPFQRLALENALQHFGLREPAVVLLTDHNGMRCLIFNLHADNIPPDKAMALSAIVDFFLPRYYLQAVFPGDHQIAVFPVQPVGAQSETELRQRLWEMDQEEEERRTTIDPDDLLHADLVSDTRKTAWQARALTHANWFLPPNEKPRLDTRQMPYRIVRPAADGETGHALHAIALYLAESLEGAVLCETLDGLTSEDADYLLLSVGDLTHLLLTGHLESTEQDFAAWLPPQEYATGQISEADVRLVPLFSRAAIDQVMIGYGVATPKMALQTLPGNRRLLLFSGKHEAQHRDNLLAKIRWCLPASYTIYQPENDRYLAWSVLSSDDTPQKRVFDLDREVAR